MLFGFFDGVLWFVKTLILLYASFYIFTIIRVSGIISAWCALIILTVGAQLFSYYTIGKFSAVSVPYFAIGVFASEFKRTCLGPLNISLQPLVVYPIIAKLLGLHDMVIVNSVVLILLVIACTRWKPSMVCPALIAAISFDLYLVHDKPLMLAQGTGHTLTLPEFLTFTTITTIIFYLIRNKITNLSSRK